MSQTTRYDTDRMRDDMAAAGMQPVDLARKCKPPVAPSTVTRFLDGDVQTARMAKRFARALKQDVERYLVRSAA